MKSLRWLFDKAPTPATAEEVEAAKRRTMKVSTVEGSVWSFMSGFGETYIMPFAVFLKASNRALAFLGTMPALIGAVSQTAGAALTDRLGRRRGPLVLFCLIQALAFLPLFLVPRLFPRYGVLAVILFAALAIGAGNAVAPAWLSLMSEVVPTAQRGDFFGRRGRVVVLTVFLATLGAGGLLSLYQRAGMVWAGFGVLFGVAFVARLISVHLLTRHYDPPYRPTAQDYFSFWAFLRRMPYSNFARFAVGAALMNGAISVASPFITVFFLRDLKWSYAQFTVNAAAFQVIQFVLVRWWGRMGDRHGNRAVIVATSCLMPVIPLLFAMTTNYWLLLLIQMFAGVAWSGFAIATQNFTFDAVTPPKRARVTAYMTILNGTFTLLGGALLGAWLASHLPTHYRLGGWKVAFLSPLPALFVVSAGLRLIAALLFLPSFKEVRVAEPIHPAMLLLRLSGGEAIAGLLQEAVARLPLPRKRKGSNGARGVASKQDERPGL
ncbi:MAG: MFS transporter [Verrucomicrobia bacterium]|nr:MFS transporter [Verrucomicrobiota bacterium]